MRFNSLKTIAAALLLGLAATRCCIAAPAGLATGQVAGSSSLPVAGPDTWGAIDGLGRTLPNYKQVGPPKPGKTVGIFYFVDRPGHGRPIYNNAEILAKNPKLVVGPLYSNHWWAKPLFGYYSSTDPFVLREHAAMLGDAGIDTAIFDNTNGPIYLPVQKALIKQWLAMRALGNRVPQFACFAGHGAWNSLYHDIYKPGLGKDLWFYWRGKPLLLYKARPGSLPAKFASFFTLRYCWAWTAGKDQWGWDNVTSNPDAFAWHTAANVPEEMPVGVAGWANNTTGRSFTNGHEPSPQNQHPGLGLCFTHQWHHALKVNPQFIFITGWNEWTAGCWPEPGRQLFAGHWVHKGSPIFVDEYSPEFSRDAEPMRDDKGGLFGGFGDNYYYQMIAFIRRYKGVHPLPRVQKVPANFIGGFKQWRAIGPVFTNNVGLAAGRDWPGWGPKKYVNNSGINSIVACKFTYDAHNLYFWLKTSTPITRKGDKAWMLLFLSIPKHGSRPGWMGYNYLINRLDRDAGRGSVEKNIGGKYLWKSLGHASVGVRGNELEIAVPRKLLGIGARMPGEIHFKWADNIKQNGAWSDFYLHGDCAPPFRFYYRAKLAGQ